VVEWLTSGGFPGEITTSTIVAGLSKGDYGTVDRDIIERDICPDAGSYVVIEVDWEDGHHPEDLVVNINREASEQRGHEEQQVEVRVRA